MGPDPMQDRQTCYLPLMHSLDHYGRLSAWLAAEQRGPLAHSLAELLADECEQLDQRLAAKAKPSADWITAAVRPDVARGSGLSRGTASQMGHLLEKVVRHALEAQGRDQPRGPFTHTASARGQRTVVRSTRPAEAVHRLASRLRQTSLTSAAQIKGCEIDTRVGSPAFTLVLREAHAELAALAPSAPYEIDVDSAYIARDGRLALGETKMGANLDTSNAPGQTEKLLRAHLAAGDPGAHLRFHVGYHTKPGKARISGALPLYWQQAGDGSGLLVDEDFWREMLGEQMTYEELRELFTELGRDRAWPI
jgi:hypothetical protein